MRLISVITATYNRADTLPLAIESVLNQTYQNIELIISDDGSTDNTRKVVEKYMRKDSRITYLNEGKSDYYTINRNRGIRKARGELLCFRDDDGYWEPDFIEKHEKRHTQDVILTYSGRIFHKDVDLPKLTIEEIPDLAGFRIQMRPFSGATEDLNDLVDVGDMMIRKGFLFPTEKDNPGYCSDMKLFDKIVRENPDRKIVLVPYYLHHYFIDHKAKTENMTLRKLKARQEGKRVDEEIWTF